MLAKKLKKSELEDDGSLLSPMYGSRHLSEPVPRYELPESQMPPRRPTRSSTTSSTSTATRLSTWPAS